MSTIKKVAGIFAAAALTAALCGAAAPPADQDAGSVVLVNSQSPDYGDWAQWMEPYFRVFGVPYEVRDLAKPGALENLGRHALIVIGHRTLDAPRRFLSEEGERLLLAAVQSGTGLVSFDGLIAARQGRKYAPLYGGLGLVFCSGYQAGASAMEIVAGSDGAHFITAQGKVPRTIALKSAMAVPGLTPAEGVTVVARAGNQPLVLAAQRGRGKAVLFSAYDWIRPSVKGRVYGLDDLVWRSLVWAARKPFVIRGMPRLLAFRVDDVSGFGIDSNKHLGWAVTANRYGLKPWMGVFIDDMREDAEATRTLARLTQQGMATASPHARRWSQFLFLDEPLQTDDAGRNIAGRPWPDEKMAANWKEAEHFFDANRIARSKVVLPHFYQFALNNFEHVARWGAEFVGTVLEPGKGYGTPLIQAGPYLTSEPPRPSSAPEPLYIADWLKIPGRPGYDRRFFNFNVEIRDDAGYEWAPSKVPVAEAIRRGIDQSRREFDSMLPAVLFTHESDHIQHIPPADWDRILSGVMEGLKPYRPGSVTLDELCRYARALHTSELKAARYDPATGQGTAYFEGVTDVGTKFYVWEDAPAGPLDRELEVPPFRQRQTARWSAHVR